MTDVVASLAVAIGASFLLSVIAKATLVAGAGLLVVTAMRRVRASRRALVLAWTFVVLAGLPAVALVAGPFTIVVRETTAFVAPAPDVSPDRVTSRQSHVETAVTPRPGDPMTGRGWIAWEGLVAGVWGAGLLVCLLPIIGTMRRLRRQRRAAHMWGTRGTAIVLQHPDVLAPMTYGLRRPVILLPQDLAQWSDADVERALVHEIEHVNRRDWPVHLLARFVCACYWFHPLVWRAWRRMYLEADRACDDAVVSGGSGQAFAEQLVALAGRVSSAAPTLVPSMAAGDLSRRVLAMVNPDQARGRSGRTYARLVAVIAVAVGAAISPITAVEDVILIPVTVSPVPVPEPAPAAPSVDRSPNERVLVRATPVVRLALAQMSQRPEAPVAPEPPPPPPPVVDTQAPVSAVPPQPPEYTVNAGDVLAVMVYRHPELSAEVLVTPDGRIMLPLIGGMVAAGLTPTTLNERITAAMKLFIEEPRSVVAVKQISTPWVTIVGEIAKPGRYPLLSPTTVLELIALGGGLTTHAAKEKIIVIRAGQSLPFDYNAIAKSERLEQNIQLLGGDMVVVP